MKTRLFTDKNIARIGNFVDDHVSSVSNLKNDIPPFSSVEFVLMEHAIEDVFFVQELMKKTTPIFLNP